MEDFSSSYTVEFYGTKGWEVGRSFSEDNFPKLGLILSIFFAEKLMDEGFQVRITTPATKENELVESVKQIHDEFSRGLTTPFELSERVVTAVVNYL